MKKNRFSRSGWFVTAFILAVIFGGFFYFHLSAVDFNIEALYQSLIINPGDSVELAITKLSITAPIGLVLPMLLLFFSLIVGKVAKEDSIAFISVIFVTALAWCAACTTYGYNGYNYVMEMFVNKTIPISLESILQVAFFACVDLFGIFAILSIAFSAHRNKRSITGIVFGSLSLAVAGFIGYLIVKNDILPNTDLITTDFMTFLKAIIINDATLLGIIAVGISVFVTCLRTNKEVEEKEVEQVSLPEGKVVEFPAAK